MTSIFPYFIAGISTIAFFTLWFLTSYRELTHKKQEVMTASEQVKMHRTLLELQEQGSPNVNAAKRMLDTSYMIYVETVKGYNLALKNPIHYFSGLIMGFRFLSETEPQPLMNQKTNNTAFCGPFGRKENGAI